MTSGGRELVKWVALVLMTGDHVNRALLEGAYLGLADAGRLVFPLFALVLACNLVRLQAIRPALQRLVVVALVAQVPYYLAFGYAMPLNVLATFALALVVMLLWIRERWILACVIGLAVSPLVDYGAAGVALVVCAWCWFRGERWAALGVAAALVGICVYNGNAWALLALPILWALGRVDVPIPRVRWLFLAYYVGHLAVLAVLAAWLGV